MLRLAGEMRGPGPGSLSSTSDGFVAIELGNIPRSRSYGQFDRMNSR